MAFTLIYFKPEGGEERFSIESGRSYRIGHSSSNDLVFPQRDVSREHAILHVRTGSLQIVDLKSKNGTFINGNRTQSAEFQPGDYVNISSARFLVVDEMSMPESGSFREIDVRAFGFDSDSGGVTKALCRYLSMDDFIDLFAVTARSLEDGTTMEPLIWGVSRLGLTAGLVLYREPDLRVSVVASAGDLGGLLGGLDLENLANQTRKLNQPSVYHLQEIGEDVLLSGLNHDYFLVLRHESSPPAVGDVLILGAAINMVLSGRKLIRPTGSSSAPDLEELASLPLVEARRRFEEWMISKVLGQCRGNQSETARRLGMTRAGLYKRMKKSENLD